MNDLLAGRSSTLSLHHAERRHTETDDGSENEKWPKWEFHRLDQIYENNRGEDALTADTRRASSSAKQVGTVSQQM